MYLNFIIRGSVSLGLISESDSGLSQDHMVKVKSSSTGMESKSTLKVGGRDSGGKRKEKAMGGHSQKKK